MTTTQTTAPPQRTSTTSLTLRRFRAWLLAGAATLLAVAGVLCVGANRTAAVATDRAAQAAIGVAEARHALSQADSEAIAAFSVRDVPLAGPDESYLGQISLASQDLERVAEANEAAGGSQTLRLVDGLLGAYSEMIEQAHAAYASGSPLLGGAYLWHASQFMHAADGGILTKLAELEREEQDAMRAKASSFWNRPWTVLGWAVPGLALLAGLIRVQLYLSRRFQRTFNVPLVAATALLMVALASAAASALVGDTKLTTATRAVDQTVQTRVTEAAAMNDQGHGELGVMLRTLCPQDWNDCGATLTSAFGQSPAGPPAAARPGADLATSARTTTGGPEPAWYSMVAAIVMATAAVAVAGLVLTGMWSRISEYRFQR